MRPVPPPAASSHSASFGSRPLAHLQYAFACAQATQLIGWSWRSTLLPLHSGPSLAVTASLVPLPVGAVPASVQAPAATHLLYAATVTSVLSMHSVGPACTAEAGQTGGSAAR
jgi:hypothetical protein